MRRTVLAAVTVTGVTAMLAGTALTEENWGPYEVGDKRSGYTYAKAETRAIQDDDFENPAMLWVDSGGELWEEVEGEAGKSCASCHGNAAGSMAEVGTTYPVYFEPWKKLMNSEQRINLCRTENTKAVVESSSRDSHFQAVAFMFSVRQRLMRCSTLISLFQGSKKIG